MDRGVSRCVGRGLIVDDGGSAGRRLVVVGVGSIGRGRIVVVRRRGRRGGLMNRCGRAGRWMLIPSRRMLVGYPVRIPADLAGTGRGGLTAPRAHQGRRECDDRDGYDKGAHEQGPNAPFGSRRLFQVSLR